jgi:hypothetical protein
MVLLRIGVKTPDLRAWLRFYLSDRKITAAAILVMVPCFAAYMIVPFQHFFRGITLMFAIEAVLLAVCVEVLFVAIA